MASDDRINAPIHCHLKMSTIAWAKCEAYRQDYQCLCKEARDRLRIKGDGREAFEQKLRAIRVPAPSVPEGWTVERMSRFYVIHDEDGEVVHRATNQAECDDYLYLAAQVQHLRRENLKLWSLLEDELTDGEDPWDHVDAMIAQGQKTGV